MMTKLLRCFLVVAALLTAGRASAQRFDWSAEFDYSFDNREYKDIKWEESMTLYGAKLVPAVGIGWGDGHQIMAGVTLSADFGHRSFFTDPEMQMYYRFHRGKYNAIAGRFSRSQIIGHYPNAFFSDSVRFYDSNLDGLLLQLVGKRGFAEIGCDWNSMYSTDRREKFMLFGAAEYRFGPFYVGANANMYHHAGTYTDKGVVDNVLLNPHFGVRLSQKLLLDSLAFNVGFLQAFQNDRHFVGEYVCPNGVQIDLRLEKFRFGINNSLYLGENLMPYYSSLSTSGVPYGAGLYYGEPFYRTTTGLYNRLEIFYQPRIGRNMRLKVASVHHFDGKNWGWQQWITFSVNLNRGMFAKK